MGTDPANPYRPPVEPADHEPLLAPARLSGYLPGGWLAKTAVAGLWITIGVVGASTLGWTTSMVFAWVGSVPAALQTLATGLTLQSSIGSVIERGTGIATAVVFCGWLYRAHANIQRAFRVADLAFSPGWAFWGFIIPLANLIIPQRVAREVWVASHRGIRSMKSRGAAAVSSSPVRLWWGMFLLSNLAAVVGVPTQHIGPVVAYLMMLVSGGVTVVAAIITIRMIRGIETLQAQRATGVDDAGVEPAVMDPSGDLDHHCPACGATYNPDDYSAEAAHIYCGTCKAELPRQPSEEPPSIGGTAT